MCMFSSLKFILIESTYLHVIFHPNFCSRYFIVVVGDALNLMNLGFML
jgi:hypothetical protein